MFKASYESNNNEKETNNNKKNNHVESVLATSGQDSTLIIWSTNRANLILVTHDIVEKSIADMCWSPNGSILIIISLDPNITLVSFQSNELGVTIQLSQNMTQLYCYWMNKDSLEFSESVKQLL